LGTIIRRVRGRWRLKQLLKGLAITGGVLLVALLISGLVLETTRFAETPLLVLRVVSFVSLLAVAVWFLFRPLARRVTDDQVALYLEENEPGLAQSVISAVDVTQSKDEGASAALVQRVVLAAVEACRRVEDGRRIERTPLRRWGGALIATVLLTVAAFTLGPAYLRHGAAAILIPTVDAAEANPYSVSVQPGDATLSRGSDLSVQAQLVGFSASDATLFWRMDGEETYDAIPMIPNEQGSFEALVFALPEGGDYFIESTGVRSESFRVDVEDLPYVSDLTLEYRFPAYTGLAPQVVESGGDVAVLRGTTVMLSAQSTQPTPAGNLVMGDSTRSALENSGADAWTGSFRVDRDGSYAIEFQANNGTFVPASPEFVIDVLEDQAPSVSIVKPGRDSQASPIEEVFIEARADDDYGVREIELVYSVNGGPEDSLPLFSQGGSPRVEVTAGHTFFLEEIDLEPGDVISYYVRAMDTDRVQGAKTVTSDMYFLQIRPFRKDFEQSEQGGMPGGGGGGGGMDGSLPEQQRQIISGTFNLVRDRLTYTDDAFSENVVMLRLAQDRLRAQVEGLVEQIKARGVADDAEAFVTIAEELPLAILEMGVAIDSLEADLPKAAIPSEQKALQHLLRAEEAFRTVQIQSQQGGGGGGGGNASAEELADLFELELDKMKNQYETVQRQEQNQTAQEIDETLERLKELARRQEQAAERQRQLAQGSPNGGGGGGSAAQRELADETERAARELERLSRERRSEALAETARQLQDAAEDMRRAASARGNQSASDARDALNRLRDARRRLEENQDQRIQQGAEAALDRSRRLGEQQRDVTRDVMDLPTQSDQGSAIRRLSERKTQMEEELQSLESDLDRLAAEALRDREQQEAGAALREAANRIRDLRIKEKMRYTRGVIQQRPDQSTRALEEQIQSDLEQLDAQLREAISASEQSGNGAELSEAMDQARDLVRGLESLEERVQGSAEENRRRLGERAQQQSGQGEPGEPGEGQAGEQGEGQQGQAGEQGEGQQGQAGEQGEGQQGQGQQGQGQQGQAGQQGQGGQQGGQGGANQDRGGMANGFGPGAQGDRGELSEDEIRQLQRAYREQRRDAEALRDQLREAGADAGELDGIVQSLRAFDDQRVYEDLAEIEALQAALLEEVKRFEFGLRRAVEREGESLLLRGSGDVPPGYEELIREYYKALAEGRRGGGN